MKANRIAIDISQLYSWPAASGVQRTLLGLLKAWPHVLLPAECVFFVGEAIHRVGVDVVVAQLGARFESGLPDAHAEERFREGVWRAQHGSLTRRQVPVIFDGWLLPEPSYRHDSLTFLKSLVGILGTAAVLYDILPEIAGDKTIAFPRHSHFSEYFRTVAGVDVCASISQTTRDQLLHRLRRGADRRSPVVLPGVDHATHAPMVSIDNPTFVSVSSISPRKRIDLIVRAFSEAAARNPNMSLRIIGRRTPATGSAIQEIRAARAAGFDVTWIEYASDARVWAELSRATASVLVGVEGYGLTGVESLFLGTPVIGSVDVPSLRPFEGRGAMVLRPLSEETLAEALLSLTDDDESSRMRASINKGLLPCWSDFARGVAVSLWLELNAVGADLQLEGLPGTSDGQRPWPPSGVTTDQMLVPIDTARRIVDGVLNDRHSRYSVDGWSFNLDSLNGCGAGAGPSPATVRSFSATMEGSDSEPHRPLDRFEGSIMSDSDDTHAIISLAQM